MAKLETIKNGEFVAQIHRTRGEAMVSIAYYTRENFDAWEAGTAMPESFKLERRPSRGARPDTHRELARLNRILGKPATRTVTNLMTGQPVEIAQDTPLCCDPSSETYWSM